MTIVEFLTARLAEDEAVARATEHHDGPMTMHWRIGGARHHRFDNGSREDYSAVYAGDWARILVARDMVAGAPLSEHIARHDPARVLAEVAAKRKIVFECDYATYDMDAESPVGRNMADAILSLLALPYSGHPDYQQEWKPL